MPSVFHHAMLSAFHEKWPNQQDWEHDHKQPGHKNAQSSCRFGGLQTIGVFPERSGAFYFPMPADVQFLNNKDDNLCVLEPRELQGSGDLPDPLKMGLFKPDNAEATKRTPNRWISLCDLMKYLNGDELTEPERMDPLFDVENRPGIGIDPETGTADTGTEGEGGKIYLAEYLRLRPNVSLKAFAKCEQVRYADQSKPADVLATYFGGTKETFVFGGQRGVAHLSGIRDSERINRMLNPVAPAGRFIKWVTLTPAIFTGGWLPSWIDSETGKILAPTITKRPDRRPGESRAAWRARFETIGIDGQLVAASIPKPIPYSGWRTSGGTGKQGAKPTRLCVPAGAVYYFEVTAGDPAALIQFLNGKCKSDISAEKGFGFGLCGVWKEYNGEENN